MRVFGRRLSKEGTLVESNPEDRNKDGIIKIINAG
jgi:hypothetical protein